MSIKLYLRKSGYGHLFFIHLPQLYLPSLEPLTMLCFPTREMINSIGQHTKYTKHEHEVP